MADARAPWPICSTRLVDGWCDDGTLARTKSPLPGPVGMSNVFDRERAIRHPGFALYFRRYAPFETFGYLPLLNMSSRFEGDNRSASTSLNVTSRTYGAVFFDQEGVFYHFANADATKTQFDPWGVFRAPWEPSTITGHAHVAMAVDQDSTMFPGEFSFSASTAGAMPLLPNSLTPDINTFVNVTADFHFQNVLRINGEVFGDNFPNLEVFVICLRSRQTALLLDGQTTGGRDSGPLWRLNSSNNKFLLGKFGATLPLSIRGELESSYVARPSTLPDYPNFIDR